MPGMGERTIQEDTCTDVLVATSTCMYRYALRDF